MSSAKPIIGKNDLLSQFPNIAKEWDYEKNGDLKPTDVSFYWHPFLLELN